MQTHALQTAAALIPVRANAGNAPLPPSQQGSQGTGSFGSHLDRAMENIGAAANPPLASKPKSTQDDHSGRAGSPAATTASGPAAAPHAGAVGTPSSASAAVVLVAMSSSADSRAASTTDRGAAASSPKGLSWLMEMLPDILTGQSGLSSRSMQASTTSSQTTANGQNLGDKPVGSAPAKAAAAKSLDSTPADAVVPQPAHQAASADSSVTSSSTTMAAGKTSSDDQAGMQSAAKFLESTGLSLLSKTTSADGGALPNLFQGKSASSAAANHGPSDSSSAVIPSGAAHTEPAAGAAAQVQAKDAAGSNAAAVQAQTTHADSSPAVKPAAAPSGDGSKNGASQDSAGKSANSGQTPGVPAVAAQGAAASAAGNAVQAAANGVPAALGQAAAAGNPSSHAGNPPQGASPQTTVSDRVAAAMDSPVSAPGNVVNAASLVETQQGRSEMRVAVQTESMGTLQLHAVLDSGRVGASISVVGHEAHTLLSNELPALQQVLADQNLRIDHLTVINSPMSSGAGGGDARNFQSGDFNHPQGRDARWYSPAPIAASRAADALAPADVRRRLSVRA